MDVVRAVFERRIWVMRIRNGKPTPISPGDSIVGVLF